VVLSGEGADEIFAGYDYYRTFLDDWRARLRSLLDPSTAPMSTMNHDRLLMDRPACTPSGFPLLSDERIRSHLLGAECGRSDSWEEDFLAWLAGAYDPLQRATCADLVTWLADDLLVKADRMTMAHSLEGRAPYLSPALAELALNLPQAERMTRTTAKAALRRIAGSYLPEEIVNRGKQGFVLPMRSWLAGWFKSHGTPKTYCSTRTFPGLDAVRLANLVTADLAAGVRRERLLFAVIMLLEWWSAFQSTRKTLRAKTPSHDENARPPATTVG
jgi:asparagine synthase (glutamine-hydrolysing)